MAGSENMSGKLDGVPCPAVHDGLPDARCQLYIDRVREAVREEIASGFKELDAKLFVGTPQEPALATRIDRVERITQAVSVALGTIIMAGLLAGLGTAFHHIWGGGK